ncbi:hypothetical protein BC835DRAFT_604735 [Cytidiella melzeri]|nr:hypothetical protein BC835DRAFT_604735 [Cytidiella melzeri]
MAKGGSRITPFVLSSKPRDPDIDEPQRPQSANSARMSTSSVFPSLSKLETASTDRPHTTERAGVLTLKRASSASGAATAATPSSSPYGTPIVTLKLSGPSFLDVAVKDGVTKQPLYIMETVRGSTFVYRLDYNLNEAVKAATVQWPQRVTKKSNSGRTVQLHNGRWQDTEEFLKFGTLTNFMNRRFYLPHFPHPLKWKPGPNSTFQCVTQGIKGPIAVLEPAYLNAPPRIRIYKTMNDDNDSDRQQQDYNGVPVLVLDYLLTTALLLVTDSQEWLDRKANDSGLVRISGSSNAAVKRWLAIIHNEPLSNSPTCESPMTTIAVNDAWDLRNPNRISGASSSAAGSSSSDPMTPITPATSTHSFKGFRDSEIPPVPPIPENARARPTTLDVSRPYSAMGGGGGSSGEVSPSASIPGPLSAPLHGSYSHRPHLSHGSSRPLPRPPVMLAGSAASLRPQTSPSGMASDPATFYSPNDPSSSASSLHLQQQQASPLDRPSTPSTSSASSGTAPRRSFGMHQSLALNHIPAAGPPPSTSLPLPPKLAEELSRQLSPRSFPDTGEQGEESRGGGGLQLMNPDPLAPEEEERLREHLRQLAVSQSNAFVQGSSAGTGAYLTWMAAPLDPSGHMVDAGLINIPSNAARRQSYAETVYEQPPPAYDAIDFTLRAHLPRPVGLKMLGHLPYPTHNQAFYCLQSSLFCCLVMLSYSQFPLCSSDTHHLQFFPSIF